MSEYPELEKKKALQTECQAIGQFLDESKYVLCEWSDKHECYWPTHKNIEQLIAEHFDLDLEKMEQERQAILDSLGGVTIEVKS